MKRSLNGIEYHYIDPTGNITVLVETQVAQEYQPEVAAAIMQAERDCEQVGFLSNSDKCDIKLRMAAGEFCGNATMSAAAFYCDRTGLLVNGARTVSVESSGCDKPVMVDITRLTDYGYDHTYNGSVYMPHHKRIVEHTLYYGNVEFRFPVVSFDGIMHIIAYAEKLGLSDAEAEDALKIWCRDLNAACLGLMLVSADMSRGRTDDGMVPLGLRPLVYVPALGTCVWEKSCASGTTAVGAYFFDNGMDNVNGIYFTEPGGVLLATPAEDKKVILSGLVRL